MSFDWSDYLALAKEKMAITNEFADQEAVYRCVISRAYYGVYCQARNCVRDVDKAKFHGNDHQALQSYLKKHPHKTRKKLGLQLQSLHQHRIKADYHDDLDEQAVNKASRAISSAHEIAKALGELFS
jgi:uncharacterized protein (UPF0332 family)